MVRGSGPSTSYRLRDREGKQHQMTTRHDKNYASDHDRPGPSNKNEVEETDSPEPTGKPTKKRGSGNRIGINPWN